MPQDRQIDVEVVNGITVAHIVLKKILDEDVCVSMGNILHAFGDDPSRDRLIVDFDGVEYVCSAFLAKMITLERKQTATSGKLRLCGIRSDILEVFKITHLDTLFHIKETRGQALEAF